MFIRPFHQTYTTNSTKLSNPQTGKYTCPTGMQAFCAGASLTSNIIIRCSGTVGTAGNCNDELVVTYKSPSLDQLTYIRSLADIPPRGVKNFAPCYETSTTAGDASCSYHGVVYPSNDSGYLFFLPSSTNDTISSLSGPSASVAPTNNISIGIDSLTAMPTQTQWVAQAISAALENQAPYPTPGNGSTIGTLGASGTGAGGMKPTGVPFKGGAGTLKVGGCMVKAMGMLSLAALTI